MPIKKKRQHALLGTSSERKTPNLQCIIIYLLQVYQIKKLNMYPTTDIDIYFNYNSVLISSSIDTLRQGIRAKAKSLVL